LRGLLLRGGRGRGAERKGKGMERGEEGSEGGKGSEGGARKSVKPRAPIQFDTVVYQIRFQ